MLALIPARGQSKGLPGKNLRSLAGKPLIVHTVEAALAAESIDRTVVSTDSEDIAEVARSAGAEVPFMRPRELATDTSPAIDTYLYTCERLEKETGRPIRGFAVLLPTAPLRTAEDIDAGVRLFEKKKADSVISVRTAECPLEWLKRIDSEGVLRDALPGLATPVVNRQALAAVYRPDGALYVFNHEFLRRTRQYYSEKTYAYVMDRNRSVDIDDLLEFEFAEFLMHRSGGPSADR